MGATTGALLGHDNILADAMTSGAGAVIGECVAEALADRKQLMKEARLETYDAKGQFDEEYFNSVYRSKLQPYVDIGRLAAGAVIAATGQDPTMSIAAATNALENNFASPDLASDYEALPEDYKEVVEDYKIAVKESIVEVMEDIRRNPEEYAKEAAIGATPYGDIVRKVANGEKVSAVEFGIETGFIFVPIGKIINTSAKTGGKIFGKFTAAVARRMEKNGAKKTHPLAGTRKDKVAHDNYFTRKAERTDEYRARTAQASKKSKVERSLKQPKSPAQLTQEIKRGQAPRGFDRVDPPHNKTTGEQTHVHFKDGSALNIDGTWKDGNGILSNAQKEWLIKNGWKL